jgi:hypothetical protein
VFIGFGKEEITNIVQKINPFPLFLLSIFKEFYETPRSLPYV